MGLFVNIPWCCLYNSPGLLGTFMDSKIRQPENWLEQQQSLLDAYIERVFESESIDDWFGAAHWYVDAISTLFGSNLKRT